MQEKCSEKWLQNVYRSTGFTYYRKMSIYESTKHCKMEIKIVVIY